VFSSIIDLSRGESLKKKKARKKVKTKEAKKVPVKAVKKVEITPLTKRILWLLAADSRATGEIRDELNIEKKVAKSELAKLVEGGLVSGGGYLRRYELTKQGSNLVGSAKVRLDARVDMNRIKSGKHTVLTITSKNIGERPVEDTILRITSPRFINVSRHGSNYSREMESFVLEFPIGQLNSKESQMKIFDLHGKLTEGTITSKYKVLVEAITANKVRDRKELTITVEK
jgi:hypothetical protein